MIELKIIAADVGDLAAQIENLNAQYARLAETRNRVAKTEKVDAGKTVDLKVVDEKTLERIMKAAVETEVVEEPAAADPKVAYSDVQKAINGLALAKGRDAAVALLAEFSVSSGKELAEGQWAAVVERAAELAK